MHVIHLSWFRLDWDSLATLSDRPQKVAQSGNTAERPQKVAQSGNTV